MPRLRAGPLLARWGPPVLIASLTFAAFLPCLWNEFVWDDDIYLRTNTRFHGFAAENIRWMFSTRLGGDYQPITWLSWAVDHAIWEGSPFGYHLTNVLLHVAAALVFYAVAIRLIRLAGGRVGILPDNAVRLGAALATLLFAVHPLRVEAVAWAANRAYVLPGFFYLLSVLYYLRYVEARHSGEDEIKTRFYAISLAVFLLSLLATPIGVSLPLVLLVLDAYPLRSFGGSPLMQTRAHAGKERTAHILLEKLPFFVLALGGGLIALFSKAEVGALSTFQTLGLGDRIAIGAYNLVFHLQKSVLPVGLSPLVVMPVDFNPLSSPFVRSTIVAAAATVILILFRRRYPAGLAAWVYYLIVLMPVLGFVHHGVQLAADRSGYLATLSFALLAGGVVTRLLASKTRGRRPSLIVGAAVVITLAVLTHMQARVWHDSKRLWNHCLARDPNCYVAHYNLGVALTEEGDLERAAESYRCALRIQPGYADAANNLGNALKELNRPAEAIVQYQAALKADPEHADALNNLGSLLASMGRLDQAERHLRRALEIDPGHPLAHNNLGDLLRHRGDLGKAIEHYRAAVDADSGFATARRNLADSLLDARRVEEALEQYRHVLRIHPEDVAARNNLVVALIRLDQFEDAIRLLREGLDLVPNAVPLTANLSRLLATCPRAELRNVYEAIELAEKGAAGDGADDPQMHYALATAYHSASRHEPASQAAQQAVRLAVDQGNLELARHIAKEFNRYPASPLTTRPSGRQP